MRQSFEALFEASSARLALLSRGDARHFIEHGHVVIRDAFSRAIADAVCNAAWEALRDHGVERDDPQTWDQPLMGSGTQPGYARTAPTKRRFILSKDAPRAWRSQVDLVGGAARLDAAGERLIWRDAAIANLGIPGRRDEDASPAYCRPGWHKDGWHFRHFLGSPEQGLLTVPIFTDIKPQSGGTLIAKDSIAPVARLLATNPQGLHPDGVQGRGYLIPGLIEQCSEFVELTGRAGDMVLLHPFILHRVCANASPRPRFIANVPVVLSEPMRFDRAANDPYSLIELAILHALGTDRIEMAMTRDARIVVPTPFREGRDIEQERAELEQEMTAMAVKGILTPVWGPTQGYMSNRPI